MTQTNNGPGNPFTGKTFVVTGKITGMTRGDAEAMIQQMGGMTASSVTAKTDFLVVGEKPGSKLRKANALGIPVMEEAEFLEQVDG